VIDLDLHLPGIIDGDQAAITAWLVSAERPVRDALRSFAASVDTESVVQEALLRAWQIAPRIEHDGRANALLRFAVRAACNLALDEVRRRRRYRPPDDDEAFERFLDQLVDRGPAPPDPLLRKLIQKCRSLLAPQPRRALEARLEASGGESDQAIAARLGLKLNTFLQNFTRARRALAECLERQGVQLDEELP